MRGKVRYPNVIFGANLRPESAGLAILLMLLLLLFFLLFLTLLAPSAQAQTYTVIHNFTGGADGKNPWSGLTMDAAGNLYGTTCGALCAYYVSNTGTVFRLSKKGSGWLFTTLYVFRGGNDGAGPDARLIIGPNGSLYGTTMYGGGSGCGGSGCGTVFNLQPPPSTQPSTFGGWLETVLYAFQGGSDGANPGFGDLVFDESGNLYGTTSYGGNSNEGAVFQLTPTGGGWMENTLYSFTGLNDGGGPFGGVVLDQAGKLYGTTITGGGGYGTVFELTPSGSGWTETVLHSFQGGSDGGLPIGGLNQDNYGVTGTTSAAGTHGGGTAYILNNPMFLDSFSGNGDFYSGPWSNLVEGPIGVSGTTYADGAHYYGSVFYMYGCAGWVDVTLHDFTGGSDGAYPVSNLLFDANGNIFGTTSQGGAYGFGVVFEITDTENSANASGCARGLESTK